MAGLVRKHPSDDGVDDANNDTPFKRLRRLMEENPDVCPIAPNNEVYNRFIFNSRRQHEGETLCHFLAELQRLAGDCNYQHLCDQMVVDALVLGVQNKGLQVELLGQPAPLTLERCRELCELQNRKGKARPDTVAARVETEERPSISSSVDREACARGSLHGAQDTRSETRSQGAGEESCIGPESCVPSLDSAEEAEAVELEDKRRPVVALSGQGSSQSSCQREVNCEPEVLSKRDNHASGENTSSLSCSDDSDGSDDSDDSDSDDSKDKGENTPM